jgi:uncharacterized membrane protein
MMEANESKIAGARETARIESFSDGVFAIAITLLILDVHVPAFKPGESLLHALSEEWGSLLAMLIGFFTILICWINHHYMFQFIHRSNSILLLLNGFKLLVVTVTPFATAILSKHIQTDWSTAAVSIYCFNFTLMGVAMTGIWSYANKKGFAISSSSKTLKASTNLYLFAALCSTSIWILSYFTIVGCLALSFIMFGIFLFPKNAVAWMVDRSVK